MRHMSFLLTILIVWFADGYCNETPDVRVSNVRRVFHNGQHNAFTDLVKYQDHFYLTFRSCPDGHMVHPTASIVVLRSEDLSSWQQVFQFSVPKRDTRDPHFLVFQNRLLIYTGTWYSGETTIPVKDYDLNLHLGYAVWSNNGLDWHGPEMLEGTFGHYIWRAVAFDGKAYLCGRRKHEFDVRPRGEGPEVESAMLVSRDGIVWKTAGLFQEVHGDETAFLFEPDGNLLAIARRGSKPAQIVRSKPPYQEWDRRDLDRYIGGPLLVRWGDRLVVGGRRSTDRGPKTSMCWLVDDQLHQFAELPSGGDNSYPGFLQLSPTRAVMSWYSSHEKDANEQPITAIYMADLEITAEEASHDR